jgi:hypothetical protein
VSLAEGPGAKKAPVEELPKEEVKEEEKAEVIEEAPEEKKARRMERWIKTEGGDFAYRNVALHQGSYTFVTQFDGEMKNNSGMDYSIVKFAISTFDGRGRLLTTEAFHVIDFNNGQTKPFKGTAIDGFREIASFTIKLKSGVAAAKY